MIFAKTNPVQTIPEHTEDLQRQYKLLTNYLRGKSPEGYTAMLPYDHAIKMAIKYHDYGKINYHFQKKMHQYLGLRFPRDIQFEKTMKDEIPHGWASLAFLSKEDKVSLGNLKDAVVYAIALHHNRDTEFDKNAYNILIRWMEYHKNVLNISYPLSNTYNISQIKRYDIPLKEHVYIKGILHRCDYSASAGIDIEKPYQGDYSVDIKNFFTKKNYIIQPFQQHALDNTNKSVVLQASTGMGKTEYAMLWGNGSKLFYTLGIRTAVNEIHKRFCAVFRKKNVALLHGDTNGLIAERRTDKDLYLDAINKVRQLSYPITISTADQLAPAVFKYPTFEIIYSALSYAKVVIDEIQSFSPQAIAAIIVMLKEIHSLGGKFLLMTATLPPFVKKELKKLCDNVVFPEPNYSQIKRHMIQIVDKVFIDELTIENLIREKIKNNKKVLVICNTIRMAQIVTDKLKDLNPNLFHSNFSRRDRSRKEFTLIRDGKNIKDSGCVWVTTQVVESSLDIDFDILITEAAPVESLFQRMGRVYRKRPLDMSEPNVYITYASQESLNLIYDREILQRGYFVLLNKYNNKLLSEEDKQNIIEEVFDESFVKKTNYYEKYEKYKILIEAGFRADTKGEARNMFRENFNSIEVIPKSIYDKNKVIIDSLIQEIDERANDPLKRIKAKYKVLENSIHLNLRETKYEQVVSKKIIMEEKLENSEFINNRNIIIVDIPYDYKTGLKI